MHDQHCAAYQKAMEQTAGMKMPDVALDFAPVDKHFDATIEEVKKSTAAVEAAQQRIAAVCKSALPCQPAVLLD